MCEILMFQQMGLMLKNPMLWSRQQRNPSFGNHWSACTSNRTKTENKYLHRCTVHFVESF